MALPVLRRRGAGAANSKDHAVRPRSGQGERLPEQRPLYRTPWAELAEMHERMGRMLSDALDPRFGPSFGFGEGFAAAGCDAAWCPAADVEETDDAYLVELELPGVKREDVSVEFGAGELSVHGEVKEKQRIGFLRRRTRPVGRFDYRISLPAEAADERVDASLADGVLTVRVPKTDRARRRRIAVSSG